MSMDRKTQTLEVENMDGDKFTVHLKKNLSWGETQEIQDALTSGANLEMNAKRQDVDASFDTEVLAKAKYKTIEICIAKIEKGDDEIEWSKDWMNSLKREDGDKLYEKVNEITGEKKS